MRCGKYDGFSPDGMKLSSAHHVGHRDAPPVKLVHHVSEFLHVEPYLEIHLDRDTQSHAFQGTCRRRVQAACAGGVWQIPACVLMGRVAPAHKHVNYIVIM